MIQCYSQVSLSSLPWFWLKNSSFEFEKRNNIWLGNGSYLHKISSRTNLNYKFLTLLFGKKLRHKTDSSLKLLHTKISQNLISRLIDVCGKIRRWEFAPFGLTSEEFEIGLNMIFLTLHFDAFFGDLDEKWRLNWPSFFPSHALQGRLQFGWKRSKTCLEWNLTGGNLHVVANFDCHGRVVISTFIPTPKASFFTQALPQICSFLGFRVSYWPNWKIEFTL